MLNHLKLERFRGFKELGVDLRPVSVVVGRNSSGKTSVLHAVRMAIEALSMSLEEGDPHLDADGWITTAWMRIVWDHERLCPVADWAELFTDKDLRQGSSMRIELVFDESDLVQEIHTEFSYAKNAQLSMNVRVRADRARDEINELPKKSRHRKDRLRQILEPCLPVSMFVPPFYGAIREEEFRSWQIVRRRLGGGDQGRMVRNLVARLGGTELNRLNDFLKRAGVGTVSQRTTAQDADNQQHLYVSFRDSNGDLELSSAGAGLVNLIALYAAMARFAVPSSPVPGVGKRQVVYLLDEPEAHLHPRLQGDIGVALANMAADFGAQLVVATHSVEMINRLHQHKDTILLAVDRLADAPTQLDTNSALLRELGQWCDLSPFASINFLSKKRILFHEGQSDGQILERCAEIYFRNQPDKLMGFRGWTLVSLSGSGNANSQGVLSAILNPELFPGITSKEFVRAICVLDRDAEREPGFSEWKNASEGHFQSRSLVWSQHSIESLFVEPNRLTAWLLLILPRGGISEGQLRKLCEEGITKVNADEVLNDAAIDQRATFHRRGHKEPGGQKKYLDFTDAQRLARKEVRAAPEIWQKGKDRAAKVLQHVRSNIQSESPAVSVHQIKNSLLSTVHGIIEKASVSRLGDPAVLIPEEIRSLLDEMAQ